MPDIERLTMVWNAESGAATAFLDLLKKLLHVGDCALCDLTHRGASQNPEWSKCWQAVGVPVKLLHRDDLDAPLREASLGRFPCVVAHTNSEIVLLLGPEDVERCGGSVEALREAVRVAGCANALRLGCATAAPHAEHG